MFATAVSSSRNSSGLQAALDGVGLAYVPFDLIEPHVTEGRLMPVLEEWWPQCPGFHLYYANRRQISPALALVVDALRFKG
ncbi:MAG: LysR substrate-binding domain-containing protein [Cupriavidus necator]